MVPRFRLITNRAVPRRFELHVALPSQRNGTMHGVEKGEVSKIGT